MSRNTLTRLLAATVCVLLYPGLGLADKPADLSYKTEFIGELDDELLDLLKAVSRLSAAQGESPSSLGVLRSRADGDVERLNAVLRSQGYYDGLVATRIDSAARPLVVVVRVETGPAYLWSRFDIVFADAAPPDARERVEKIRAALPLGERAVAEEVLAAELDVAAVLVRRDFPFAQVSERKAVVDHATRELDVEIKLVVGPRAVFGPMLAEGVRTVDEVFVERRVTWVRGQPWNAAEVERSRRRLTETGLFSSVRVEAGEALEGDGELPMVVRLEEAKHRSIGLGVGYSSTEGAGVSAFWEHRNVFSGGERLRFALKTSELEQSLRATYREPDFLRQDQQLLLDTGYARENTDAFDSRKITASVGVERRLTDDVSVVGGLALEQSEITEDGELGDHFFLVGTPLQVRRDTSDDLLDPTRGSRFEISAVPYLHALGSEEEFYIARATHSAYLPIGRERRHILAARLSVGSISGADRRLVPADKRFYAGGGGSIRGYGYQLVGPLDEENDPIGGRSLFEAGAELRVRLTDSVGLVPFVEGGNVFEETVPDFSRALLWGAGIGVRYFTAVGPIRLDIGVPLHRRQGVDDALQFYISLGQAF